MSRRLEVAAAVAVAAVFAGGAVVAAPARDGGSDAPAAPMLTATTRLDPSELLFGDAVHAEVDVVTSVPVRLVRLATSFGPYRVESETRTTTPLAGSRTQIRHRFTLSCLRTACAIEQGQPGRVFAFPAAQVSAGGLQVEADWKPLTVFTRTLTARSPTPRTGEAFWLPPHHAASNWPAGLGAGVLLLVAALAPLLLRRRRAVEPAADAHLREALVLARDIAASVSVARIRAALEDVASELERAGRRAAAARVRLLAWAELEPDADEVAALTTTIERELV
jgi:hypothetical protein